MVFDFNTILDLVLTFVVGLLFGLAIKKGAIAFVLAIVGVVIGGYVGLTFFPKVSVSYETHKALVLLTNYVQDVNFGSVAVSLTVIFFLVGLAIGLWKG